MLTKERLEKIGESLKELYQLPKDSTVRIPEVYGTEAKDAVISVGECLFAITESDNGTPVIAAGRPLRNVKFKKHGEWFVTTMDGMTMPTRVQL